MGQKNLTGTEKQSKTLQESSDTTKINLERRGGKKSAY